MNLIVDEFSLRFSLADKNRKIINAEERMVEKSNKSLFSLGDSNNKKSL